MARAGISKQKKPHSQRYASKIARRILRNNNRKAVFAGMRDGKPTYKLAPIKPEKQKVKSK